ncbi:MAG: hypothetical protein NTY65_08660 [Planctomycetota bacterium]|nr:hypothetical protein [Planctomycetota bacterium]
MRNQVLKVLTVAAALVLAGLVAGVFPEGAQAAGAPGKAESPPKPLVLHFKYIPAQSFMETLHQLGGNPHMREVLKEVPIALNEPANSVVVIGPPELGEMLAAIAKGLDQPNEFRDAMQQQERQAMEARLKFEEARHKLGLPTTQPGPMGPMPGGGMCPNCPMNRQGPPPEMRDRMRPGAPMGPQPEMRDRMRPGAPMGPPPGKPVPGAVPGPGPQLQSLLPEGEIKGRMVIRYLWSLLSAEGRQALSISGEQGVRIQKVLNEATGEMTEKVKEIEKALSGVPAEKRQEAALDWWRKHAPERAERAEKVRREVFEVLSPEQRERAEKWLREHPAGGESPRRPQGFRGSDGPVEPARFFQVQNAGGPPQGIREGDMMGGLMNLFGPEERERMQQIMQRGQDLRFLDDPDVRAEMKITPEQEKKFEDLKERAQARFQAISADVQAKVMERMSVPDMTDEERMAAIQEIRKVVADTVRGALNDVEGMVGEANGMLTEEQRGMLKVIAPRRAQSDQLTNGLAYLASTKAREEFAFTDDESEKIKMIVRDLETEARKARDDAFGPDKQPTAEDLRSEKFAPFVEQQKERVKKAFDRIITILTGEQREKVQKWYDTRMNRGPRGMRGGGFGGRFGGGPGGPQPGATAPTSPSEAPKPDAPAGG